MFSMGTARSCEQRARGGMQRGKGGIGEDQRDSLTESQLLGLPNDLTLVRIELEDISLLLLRGHLQHRYPLLQHWRDGGVRTSCRLSKRRYLNLSSFPSPIAPLMARVRVFCAAASRLSSSTTA